MKLLPFAMLAILAISCPGLPAENGPEQEATVRLDLMPVCLGGDMEGYYFAGGKVQKLEAFESAMGTPVFYKGPRALRVYASEADARPRQPGEALAAPVAATNLPAGTRRALLLFLKPQGAAPMLQSYAVDDKSFGAGDYRIHNLTKINLVGLMGKKHLQLKPGQAVEVTETAMREKDADLDVQFGYATPNRQELCYSSVWAHTASARNYVFLIGTGNPDVPFTLRKFHDIPSVQSIGYEPPAE